MQVVILCGGQGTRAYPQTRRIPKALMEVGGIPIVEQVMRIYAAQGFDDFILACGYRKDDIVAHFQEHDNGWSIRCVDTGAESDTGERILLLREALGPLFHVTYCDGLGDVDLRALVDYHQSHGGLITVTAAALRSQYGLVYGGADGRVVGFEEKPILPGYWINGGFFVFDRRVFDCWVGTNLERHMLPALAARGQLHMYRHRGFWQSMDTYKDQQELNRLWPSQAAAFGSVPAEEAV
ncbi:MAG TPA: sugar phosphate nucleotidyltransferase [Chloroflexota bacterium]|nr:sugar phosphate nucleotidyltransferase [Chloroflexota bacterium]